MADSFVKSPAYVNAKYLNDVNDSVVGGALLGVPSGVQSSQGQQTLPGDRIILDDATALALSDTAVGTLYGGIYMYVLSKSGSTAAPAAQVPAFFLAADIGVQYQVTPDAQPTAAIPTFFAGVYINAISKGQYGWIQIAGIATVTYQGTVTSTTAGHTVNVGISQTPPAFDAGVATYTALLYGLCVGVAIDAPANAGTGKKILLKTGLGRL